MGQRSVDQRGLSLDLTSCVVRTRLEEATQAEQRAHAFTVLRYRGSEGYAVFSTLVSMSGITAAIPYGFSGSPDQVAAPRRAVAARPRAARDVIVAVRRNRSRCSSSVLPQPRRGGRVEGLAAVHLLRPSDSSASRSAGPTVRGQRRRDRCRLNEVPTTKMR